MRQYIQPFIKVCTKVFKELVNLDLQASLPYFMEKNAATECDVSGVIGLTGEARGAVVISMKQELAVKLTAKLTGSKKSTPNAETIDDALGEIINIIAGNAKKELEESLRLVISLPTIIKGKGHSINWPENQTSVVCIPFTSSNGEALTLSVALDIV